MLVSWTSKYRNDHFVVASLTLHVHVGLVYGV